ncbi:hypothetical protein EJB05_35040, partial [Eragrostis curvula]
ASPESRLFKPGLARLQFFELGPFDPRRGSYLAVPLPASEPYQDNASSVLSDASFATPYPAPSPTRGAPPHLLPPPLSFHPPPPSLLKPTAAARLIPTPSQFRPAIGRLNPHPSGNVHCVEIRRALCGGYKKIILGMAARSTSVPSEDDYETQQKKQAAADVLFHYSQFVMVCIGEDVRPTDLRLHLMKEVSGMPTSLKKEPQQAATSPDSSGEPSSSGTMKGDKNESS